MLVAVCALLGVAVVVSSAIRSDEATMPLLPVESGRLPLAVEQVWEHDVEPGIDARSVRITDDVVVFNVSDRGGSFRRIEALDIATGRSIWERRIGADVSPRVLAVTESTYVVDLDAGVERVLVGYDLATGATRWEHRSVGAAIAPAFGAGSVVVETGTGAPGSVAVRDPDTGDIVLDIDAASAGLDSSGNLWLIGPGNGLANLDLAAYAEVRRERGALVAAESVVPVERGEAIDGFPLLVDGRVLTQRDGALFDASENSVELVDRSGAAVELAEPSDISVVGADRLLIRAVADSGEALLLGGRLRRNVIEIDWTLDALIRESIVTEAGPQAIIRRSSSDGEMPDQLIDLATGEVLVEFDSPIARNTATASNGVAVRTATDAVVAVDVLGETLWRLEPTLFAVAVGDEFVVTLSRTPDGDTQITGYTG
ncbi:MAG: PQQ-binding-like beta-propeller repeat protein [Ilumatobacter sp.]